MFGPNRNDEKKEVKKRKVPKYEDTDKIKKEYCAKQNAVKPRGRYDYENCAFSYYNHTVKSTLRTFAVRDQLECGLKCETYYRCVSFAYKNGTCKLSKDAKPDSRTSARYGYTWYQPNECKKEA